MTEEQNNIAVETAVETVVENNNIPSEVVNNKTINLNNLRAMEENFIKSC